MFVSRSEPLAEVPELRDLVLGDGQVALRLQVDRAGVLAVQLVELRADLAPDARLLGRVVDERRAEVAPAGASGTGRTAPCRRAMYAVVAEPGVARLEFEFGRRPAASTIACGSMGTPYSTSVLASFMIAGSSGSGMATEYSYSIVRGYTQLGRSPTDPARLRRRDRRYRTDRHRPADHPPHRGASP